MSVEQKRPLEPGQETFGYAVFFVEETSRVLEQGQSEPENAYLQQTLENLQAQLAWFSEFHPDNPKAISLAQQFTDELAPKLIATGWKEEEINSINPWVKTPDPSADKID